MDKIRVKIIGAGGYGGVGMVELLLQHPHTEIVALVAKDATGMRMSELYPHLRGHCDMEIVGIDHPQAAEPADVVLFSTPDRVGMHQARKELDAGAKVIDYSGDFRFDSTDGYADYAGRLGKETEHAAPDLLEQAVYGLPELDLADVAGSQLVGNPGCFAVSMLLGLAPALKLGLVEPHGIICDGKTGVSGAGKKPAPGFHYPARYENMNAYRLTGHQHVCEVEHQLARLGGGDVTLTLTTQVVPVTRGILTTCYGRLLEGVNRAAVEDAYRAFHDAHPFVRLYGRDADIGTAHVRGSNHCDLLVDVDERTGLLRVVSHIDNLMKGQAGNALQNLNLLCGLPETTGLDRPGELSLMASITDIQEEVVEEFALFDDWQDRYAHLIDLGRTLSPLDPAWKSDDYKVRGCQSQVWLHAEPRDGVLHLEAESDALIVQGLIALVLRIYSDQPAADILASEPAFLSRIGLDRHLSTSRNNGLQAMLATIRRHAEAM